MCSLSTPDFEVTQTIPTGEMRWLVRGPTHMVSVHNPEMRLPVHRERVLQAKWIVKHFRDDAIYKITEEWRDVPEVRE